MGPEDLHNRRQVGGFALLRIGSVLSRLMLAIVLALFTFMLITMPLSAFEVTLSGLSKTILFVIPLAGWLGFLVPVFGTNNSSEE